MARRKKEEPPSIDCSLCYHFHKAIARMDLGKVRLCRVAGRYTSSQDSPESCRSFHLYDWIWCPKLSNRVSMIICLKCEHKCSMQKMVATYHTQGGSGYFNELPKYGSEDNPFQFKRREIKENTPAPVRRRFSVPLENPDPPKETHFKRRSIPTVLTVKKRKKIHVD